jgi:hypothetical protein
MDDRELLIALEGLGLGRDNHRAVLLLPLIEVAWADGRIQRAERRRLSAIAKRYGISTTEGWLDRWLARRPSKKTFLAAHTTLLALMARHKEDLAPIETLDSLLDLCLEVAEAAGGLFGLAFTVTRSERECIEQIASSLALGPSLPEPVVVARKDARQRRQRAEAPTTLRPPRRRGPRYGILDQTTIHLPAPSAGPASVSAQVVHDPTDPFERWLARTARPDPPVRAAPGPEASATEEPTDEVGARLAPIRVAVGPPRPEPPKTPPPPPRKPPRAGRPPEEDPTLPFFDHVNVGTYALDPNEDDR